LIDLDTNINVVRFVDVKVESSSENISESTDEKREKLIETISSSIAIDLVEFKDILITLMVILI